MDRAFTNILSRNVEDTARFYQELLGMTRTGDFGWFVLLSHKDRPDIELGILTADHHTVPEEIRTPSGGAILTFVVASLAGIPEKAAQLGAEILQPPTDLPYGQRRLLLRDPAGTVVDISAPIS